MRRLAVVIALTVAGCVPPSGPRTVRRTTSSRAPTPEPSSTSSRGGPSTAAAGSGSDEPEASPDGEVHREPKPAGLSVVLATRASAQLWAAASDVAGRAMSDVFAPGLSGELDVGIGMPRVLALYAGWQHARLAVGGGSPYARLATVGAWEDRLILGAQGIPWRWRWLGVWLDGAGGWSNLHQQGEDARGVDASIDMPSFVARLAGGVTLEPARWFGVRPFVALALAQMRSATVSAASVDTSGALADPGLRLSFEPGLAAVFDLEVR